MSPDFLQGLPTDAQAVIGSAYMVEASIIKKYGLDLTLPTATSTKKSTGVRVSGDGKLGLVIAVAGGLVGFVGVLWVL